ncbi:uncharacterized protein N7459_004324 [Penicillium hispanicum]|uniref:uncharacterized protein n=1 Tax=Penicillium hispanicum TaxID=1080232 RepID=UPI002541BF80|nr:uncharacterized protein N7459_004324 [Penicillium hispanicum]KAJ5584524.1 hypothetical protein N7459_004324 [Penicillium hispanicum]
MDRPVGPPVETCLAKSPPRISFPGRVVRLEPLDTCHINDLYECISQPEHAALWTYIPDGPFEDKASFSAHITRLSQSKDPLLYSVIDQAQGKAVGYLALMRIDLKNRVVEVGHVVFSPLLQRTTAATEAFYIVATAVFEELGFRRFEWKCDHLNAPSRRAAARFGFTPEGVFRQHMVIKGRSRDTAWFSILDSEWPALKASFEKWLDPNNFDADGKQRGSLASFRGL